MRDQAIEKSEAESRMALNGLKPPVTAGTDMGKIFDPWDIGMAVRDIADMIEKTGINFIMLGELARAVKDHTDQLATDHLEIGMFQRGLTVEVKSLFKTWGFAETPYGYRYFFTPPIKWDILIPVEIYVIKRNYKFFNNPDRGWFGVDDFYIPNPFDNYWKARFIIK